MKISESWLRECIGVEPSIETLCESMTMAGFEIEGLDPVAGEFGGVVVACIVAIERHPKADRLQVCKVDAGSGDLLTIVCGATNIFTGMKVALAQVGASLPGGVKIKASRLRGVISSGMLCSVGELEIKDENIDGDGILELSSDAPLGADFRTYLALDDRILDVAITPNRGDCLSAYGLSKEIAAITGFSLNLSDEIEKVKPACGEVFPVVVDAPTVCPRYVGRVVRNINTDAVTPIWMIERLRRSGMRAISPIVDVTNYVMLEQGQPMHAFDLHKLSESIVVRYAKEDETISLLDGQLVDLSTNTLIIADNKTPLAIAGVMGGVDSGVSSVSSTIFLESAFFIPNCVAEAARFYKLGSESSFRFERGVDPYLQVKAIERATQLIMEIAGGEAGPLVDVVADDLIPQSIKTITLRHARLNQVAGVVFDAVNVCDLLSRSGFKVSETNVGWDVVVPVRRFDITSEIDLIEEVVRLYGYQNIPLDFTCSGGAPKNKLTTSLSTFELCRKLCERGYHEVITYSFVDPAIQSLFVSDDARVELVNPIASNMSAMRQTMIPGLLSVLLHNVKRQQSRVRIFETGKCFVSEGGQNIEQEMIGGMVSGSVTPLQWGVNHRDVDFFDVKGDVEFLLSVFGKVDGLNFISASHPGLHPGKTADIYYMDKRIGMIGVLHPEIMQLFDLTVPVIFFELIQDNCFKLGPPKVKDITKFPLIRRDLSILLDSSVPAKVIQDTIIDLGGGLLQSVTIFDLYQGKSVALGKKSMALALVMQHSERTLKDEEVSILMQHIFLGLEKKFGAELRG